MKLDVDGKLALVTGGDSGIGRATAETLLREGARVALCDVTTSPLAGTAGALAAHGDCRPFTADLTSLAEVERLREAVEKEMSVPDILVHCAGTTGPTGDFFEIADEGWMEVLEVDLMSAVRTCRAFVPAMREKGWGRVVLVSSENAVQPYPEETPYNVAKAGINTLAKSLSKAVGREGVHVNVVSPAFVATPMTDMMMEKRQAALGTSREAGLEVRQEKLMMSCG